MALERVVQSIGQCAEKEATDAHFNGNEAEFLGKEPGEYMLRAAIPTKASGAIIGPKGVNIQAIRDEYSAKVFIDKNVEQGHQVLKLVASLENMRLAILRINDAVQEDARSEAFKEWAAIRSFTGGAEADVSEGGRQESHKGEGKGRQDRQEQWGAGGRPRSRSPRREEDIQRTPLLQALAATVGDFPDGSLEEDYTMTCDLPRNKVSALIGKSGEHVRSIRRMTGTQVRFDEASGGETQTMIVKGRMVDVFRAHALMMRKYHEDDADSQKNAHVQGLQAQLDDIQKQLAMVEKGGGSKGAGKKGK